jgi:hypothetical protein
MARNSKDGGFKPKKNRGGRIPIFTAENIVEMKEDLHTADLLFQSKSKKELHKWLHEKRNLYFMKQNRNIIGIKGLSRSTLKKYSGMNCDNIMLI